MLSLDQVLSKDDLKFTEVQVNEGLYKFGHITKEEKEYLDKIDTTPSMTKQKEDMSN